MFPKVRAVVAETFGCKPESITETTVAEDVDGWDSLRHTILMVRLQRALGISIPESVAAESATVGDLARNLAALT